MDYFTAEPATLRILCKVAVGGGMLKRRSAGDPRREILNGLLESVMHFVEHCRCRPRVFGLRPNSRSESRTGRRPSLHQAQSAWHVRGFVGRPLRLPSFRAGPAKRPPCKLTRVECQARAVGRIHGVAHFHEALLNGGEIFVQAELEDFTDRDVIDIRAQPAREALRFIRVTRSRPPRRCDEALGRESRRNNESSAEIRDG